MTRRAWLYIGAVLITAVLLSWRAIAAEPLPHGQWQMLLTLVTLATLAQLFKAETPNHQLYYATMVFLFAAVMLLHPFFFVLVVLVSYLIEWAKERWIGSPHLRHWYLQPFNIATHVISGLCAHWLYVALAPSALSRGSVGAALLAIACYVVLNHAITGQALVLARGLSWRASGVLSLESLFTDTVQLALGYILAVLVQLEPLLALPALLPLALIYRALMVPKLKQEAHTDAKTGLWNSRYFSQLFTTEVERSSRFARPLSVIVADLDLLRNINNTYGHLAGDAVLAGVGRIIAETVREYDIAARFGGEEFVIALPETHVGEALAVAERLRQAVEAAHFQASTSATPLRATLSLGVAAYPDHAVTANDLIHEADVAVYQAKLQGRNRSVCAQRDKQARWAEPERVARLEAPYQAAFSSRPASLSDRSIPAPPEEHQLPEASSTPSQASETPAHPLLEQSVTRNDRRAAVRDGAPDLSRATQVRRHLTRLNFCVGSTIVLAVMLTLSLLVVTPPVNWQIVLGLVILALLAELLQLDLYGEGTVSISVGLNFAAAVLVGLPGVAAVSAAIAGLHYLRRKPPLYKVGFNWATHVLSGAIPVCIFALIDLPLMLHNLPVLALPALLSGSLLYGVDTGLVALAIALQEGTSVTIMWQKHFRWLAQHYLVLCLLGFFVSVSYTTHGVLGAVLFAIPILMMHYAQRQYVGRTKESISALERVNEELSQANGAVRELNDDLFVTVAHILDARDPFVSGHTAKVADYAVAIARELGVADERLEVVRQGGLLHDIGKIGIKETILYKPARLTAEEYEYMKTHATIGAELLLSSKSLRHLAPFVRHHHERWDGTGYPAGLAGDTIPLIARILAVADAVEAMASDRPYHRGMPVGEILQEVQRCAGTHFDPVVAEAFIRVMQREGEQVVVNSAREVLQKHGGEDGSLSGLHFDAWVTQLTKPVLSTP